MLFHTEILITLSMFFLFFFWVRSSPVDPGIEVFESVLHVSNEIKILFLAVKYVGGVDGFSHVLFYRESVF